MESKGRITSTLVPIAQKILFGKLSDEDIDNELLYSTQVDRAHIIMLVKQGIIKRDSAIKLLLEIQKLRNCGFKTLKDKTSYRGVYLLYENYLIEKLGMDDGGVIHTARSRNDLKVTTLLLRLRKPYISLIKELLKLQVVLINKARKHADTVMPAYTHYQAAVPITFGHYLLAISSSLERGISALINISGELGCSPLGAGAVGGTSFPIDNRATACLLGFETVSLNSINAVASRDFALRILAEISIIGGILSRLSEDLLLWASSEFGYIKLPDNMVGSSSMMPNKRNPFIVEQIQGKCVSALGAFVNASTAIHGTPMTNSIPVGTTAMEFIWKPFTDIIHSIILMRLIISKCSTESTAMERRVNEGYTLATELADLLVTGENIPFREAHSIVGTIVRDACDKKADLKSAAAEYFQNQKINSGILEDLETHMVVKRTEYGGGPGKTSFDTCLKACLDKLKEQNQWRCRQLDKWKIADEKLNAEEEQLLRQ